jgi:hypothetical protein
MAHVISLHGPLGRQCLEKPVRGLLLCCGVVRHASIEMQRVRQRAEFLTEFPTGVDRQTAAASR